MTRPRFAGVLVVLFLLVPAVASAELFLNIGIGVSFGNGVDKTQTYSGQLGGFGAGWVGFEGDYGYVVNTPYHGVALRTAGASLLVGPRLATSFGGLRPYGSVGGGIMNAVISRQQVVNPFDGSSQLDPIVTFGGGVIWQGPHIPSLGVRVDVRMIRDLKTPEIKDALTTFTRITVSLHWTFKGAAK